MTNEVKRTYTIPLRKEFLKVAKYRRTNKAVKAVQEFIKRHMKVEDLNDISMGKYLNDEMWKHGIQNPPSRIKVNVIKDIKENKVIVELFGKEIKFKDKKEKKKEGLADKVKEKLGVSKKHKKTDEERVEEMKEELKEEKEEHAEIAKETQKEEIDEMKKDLTKIHHKPRGHEVEDKTQHDEHPLAPKHL